MLNCSRTQALTVLRTCTSSCRLTHFSLLLKVMSYDDVNLDEIDRVLYGDLDTLLEQPRSVV